MSDGNAAIAMHSFKNVEEAAAFHEAALVKIARGRGLDPNEPVTSEWIGLSVVEALDELGFLGPDE